jgi:hypothetical protein
MFSAAAKLGMSNKINSLLPKRTLKNPILLGTEVVDVVHYFSAVAVGADKMVKAARLVTDRINFYASKGCVTGRLSNLQAIQLINEPHELEKYAVCCFVALNHEGIEIAKTDDSGILVKEGEIGKVAV